MVDQAERRRDAEAMLQHGVIPSFGFILGSGGFLPYAREYTISQDPEAPQRRRAKPILESDAKATKLVLGLLDKLGFEQILGRENLWWIFRQNEQSLQMGQGGDIWLNDSYRCILTLNDLYLPYADCLFAKLICLVTEVRNTISTLSKEDKNALDELLPLNECQTKISEFLKEKEESENVLAQAKAIVTETGNTATIDK